MKLKIVLFVVFLFLIGFIIKYLSIINPEKIDIGQIKKTECLYNTIKQCPNRDYVLTFGIPGAAKLFYNSDGIFIYSIEYYPGGLKPETKEYKSYLYYLRKIQNKQIGCKEKDYIDICNK